MREHMYCSESTDNFRIHCYKHKRREHEKEALERNSA